LEQITENPKLCVAQRKQLPLQEIIVEVQEHLTYSGHIVGVSLNQDTSQYTLVSAVYSSYTKDKLQAAIFFEYSSTYKVVRHVFSQDTFMRLRTGGVLMLFFYLVEIVHC
jgi:hypothetical protein